MEQSGTGTTQSKCCRAPFSMAARSIVGEIRSGVRGHGARPLGRSVFVAVIIVVVVAVVIVIEVICHLVCLISGTPLVCCSWLACVRASGVVATTIR